MIRVKLTTAFPEWPLIRQTPGEKGVWGDYQFHINEKLEECDFWIVYEGLRTAETAMCDPARTILITGEPPDLKRYDEKYLGQFAVVVTCHSGMKHPHVIAMQQAQPWHVGRRMSSDGVITYSKNYDALQSMMQIQKDRLVSVICSSKSTTKHYKNRIAFVEALESHFGANIDIYGRDLNYVEDKWDAIARYKYHVVLENGVYEHYWTEKLADAFLGGAYPLYYGCPNIHDYFQGQSLQCIDIQDVSGALRIMDSVIEGNQYEKSISAIDQARRVVLEKYNLFALMTRLCSEVTKSNKQRRVLILPEGDRPSHSRIR